MTDFFARLVVICLLDIGVSSATAPLMSSSIKYQVAANRTLPLNGVMTVGSASQRSRIQCAKQCGKLSPGCQGFTFQSAQLVQTGTGSCQPVAFASAGNVTLASSQSLYVNADLCATGNNPCMNSGSCSMARWPNICTCTPCYNGTYCDRGE